MWKGWKRNIGKRKERRRYKYERNKGQAERSKELRYKEIIPVQFKQAFYTSSLHKTCSHLMECWLVHKAGIWYADVMFLMPNICCL
jgi:hypothetical protein